MSALELLKCIELGLVFGIVATGVFITLRIVDFPDLTCDGSFVLGTAISAALIQQHVSPITAIVLASLGGAVAGAVTSLLNTRFRITPLLSGILTAFMLYSINLDVMSGQPNISLLDRVTLFSGYPSLFVLGAISVSVCAGVGGLLLTDRGLALRAVGHTPTMAENNGVSVKLMIALALILSNALIALGGALYCQLEGYGDISLGPGTVIFGLAAVMIGEKIVDSSHPLWRVVACFVGAIIYRLIVAFALYSDWIGLQTKDLNLITGLLVILIMLLPKRKKMLTSVRRLINKLRGQRDEPSY